MKYGHFLIFCDQIPGRDAFWILKFEGQQLQTGAQLFLFQLMHPDGECIENAEAIELSKV